LKQRQFEEVRILDTRIDLVSQDDLIEFMLDTIQKDAKAKISYINVHAMNIAYSNDGFRKYINSSQVVFCDGFGIKWVANLIFKKALFRITPPDWFDNLAAECAMHGFSMFFLGSRQEVVEKAAKILIKQNPKLKIVGIHHGFFNKVKDEKENRDVIKMINAQQPDILVVGFGMPMQENWIQENYPELNAHVIFPVGAFFDYFTGDVKRAPRWMTDHGLEWLGRLIIEPSRLWKRYLVGNPLFFWRVFKHHVLGRELPGDSAKYDK
jgi:N-acetylglucosaminyldiphosphoundecaprenol N-acetyl-beta-D-mannosaminyltransferase